MANVAHRDNDSSMKTWSRVFALALCFAPGCDSDSNDADTDGGTDGGTGASDSNDPSASSNANGSNATEGDTQASTSDSGVETTDESDSDPSGSGTAGETAEPTTGGPVDPPEGFACDDPFEHAGRQGCRATVGELEVKFFPLDEPAPAQRLVVFLHGDGGADYTDNWGFSQDILDWAIPQDYLVIGIRSPASYDGDTDPSFGAAQPVHADMVATTLEAFIDAYDVVEDRTLYWGVSGGSWFTTSSLIPAAGHRVPGIFVANCGGSGVSFGWEWVPDDSPEIVALNSLYMNYGDQDFLAQPSAESYAEYTEMGFMTGQLVHPGATHCAHDISGPTLDFWMSEL
ncbi:MAG: hypothetical protein ACRBN8_23720 [Nannocystales bacterium]